MTILLATTFSVTTTTTTRSMLVDNLWRLRLGPSAVWRTPYYFGRSTKVYQKWFVSKFRGCLIFMIFKIRKENKEKRRTWESGAWTINRAQRMFKLANWRFYRSSTSLSNIVPSVSIRFIIGILEWSCVWKIDYMATQPKSSLKQNDGRQIELANELEHDSNALWIRLLRLHSNYDL